MERAVFSRMGELLQQGLHMGNAGDDKMKLKVLKLLNHFSGELEKDSSEHITFLSGDSRDNVRDSVRKLLEDHFRRAEEEYGKARVVYKQKLDAGEEPKKPNLSAFLDWHEVHKDGQKLWQHLMSAAIADIDPNAKGHSELLNYLKAATEFEDLLYGLEQFYRDHTLHSLWVYLIGVKLMNEDPGLKWIAEDLNWYVFNDVRKKENPEEVVRWAGLQEDYLNEEIQTKKDAIWCIMALCHDLGYSLAKLRDLNTKVQNVLKYYDVPDFRHVGYTLDLEHQYLVTQSLELMGMDVRIVPGDSYPDDPEDRRANTTILAPVIDAVEAKIASGLSSEEERAKEGEPGNYLRSLLMREVKNRETQTDHEKIEGLTRKLCDNILIKCYRDDSSYWRLCKALERKEHGILSAYLLYKTMGLFADTSVRSPAEGWGLDDDEAVDNIIRGDILFGIAQHEFAFAHIDQMSSLAEILILCDELEEFTRLGRQLQSRKYHDTTADAEVKITLKPDPETNRGTDRREIKATIDMMYDSRHENRTEFVKFCWRKAKRLCKLFSLRSEGRKAYRINEIRTTFNYCDKPGADDERKWDDVVVFTMRDNTNDSERYAVEITVPRLKDGSPVEQPQELECRDDDIYHAGIADKDMDEDRRLVAWLWHEERFDLKKEELPPPQK